MNDLELLGLKTVCNNVIKRMQIVENSVRSKVQKQYVLDTVKDAVTILKVIGEYDVGND